MTHFYLSKLIYNTDPESFPGGDALEGSDPLLTGIEMPQIDLQIPDGEMTDQEWNSFIDNTQLLIDETFDQALKLAKEAGRLNAREERKAERARDKLKRKLERLTPRKWERLIKRAEKKADRMAAKEYRQALRKLKRTNTAENKALTEEMVEGLKLKLIKKIEQWTKEGLDQDRVANKMMSEIMDGSLSEEFDKVYDLRSKLYVIKMKFVAEGYSYKLSTRKGAYSLSSKENSPENPDEYAKELDES